MIEINEDNDCCFENCSSCGCISTAFDEEKKFTIIDINSIKFCLCPNCLQELYENILEQGKDKHISKQQKFILGDIVKFKDSAKDDRRNKNDGFGASKDLYVVSKVYWDNIRVDLDTKFSCLVNVRMDELEKPEINIIY